MVKILECGSFAFDESRWFGYEAFWSTYNLGKLNFLSVILIIVTKDVGIVSKAMPMDSENTLYNVISLRGTSPQSVIARSTSVRRSNLIVEGIALRLRRSQ